MPKTSPSTWGKPGNGLAVVPRGEPAVPEDRQEMAYTPGGARKLPGAKRALGVARRTSQVFPGDA